MPYFSVRGRGGGDGRSGILGKAKAANQIDVQPDLKTTLNMMLLLRPT
jgi:hypothetical protein